MVRVGKYLVFHASDGKAGGKVSGISCLIWKRGWKSIWYFMSDREKGVEK